MPKDWVCDSCGYGNIDDTTTYCGRCGNRRHFIKLNYRRLKVSPGSALYATSTTGDNAAASRESVELYEYLQATGEPVDQSFRKTVEKAKLDLQRKVDETFEEVAKQGELPMLSFSKREARRARAKKMSNNMTRINYMFQDRRKAKLFTDDRSELVDRLDEACVSEDDFVGKIASLASLFTEDIDPLRRLVLNPDPCWKSITLVEKMLESEKVQFDPEMIKIWKKIRDLRNSTPIHPNNPPISTLEYFGVTYPNINYEQLWDTVLNRFDYSLERFKEALGNLPRKD